VTGGCDGVDTGVAMMLAALVLPADGHMSGDWVDTVALPGGRLGVAVGDAAGHGAAAAAHARRLRRLLRAGLVAGWEPAAVVRRAVDGLGDTGEMFASAFVAVLDPAAGLLRYANAGHPEPLHLSRAGRGAVAGAVRVGSLPPTGPLLCDLFAGQDAWTATTVRFGPGDLLLIYTDGLTEARDTTGAPFGPDRLVAEVTARTGRMPGTLLADVFAAVDLHTAGHPRDDRTALAFTIPRAARRVARPVAGRSWGAAVPAGIPRDRRSDSGTTGETVSRVA
jgi:phosphoserine phosphatase RsbU/P